MAEELSPKSFRVTDATAEKFREIAQEIGGNQQSTMAKLIEVYEHQKAKDTIPEKSEQIKQFEAYVLSMTRMYMAALEECSDATSIARSEYEAQLLAKDQIITELQRRTNQAEEERKSAVDKMEQSLVFLQQQTENYENLKAEMETAAKERQRQKEQKEKLETENRELKSKAENREQRLQELSEQILELRQEKVVSKEEIEDLKKKELAAAETIETLRASLSKLENRNNELNENMQELKESLQEKCAQAHKLAREEAELEFEKKLFEKEKDFTENINLLKEKQNLTIDEYQKKYMKLLEKCTQGSGI